MLGRISATVHSEESIPDQVCIPRKLSTFGLQSYTIAPQPDGSTNVVLSLASGLVNVTSGPLSFSITALLKLIQDLATDVPVLLADVEAVFASTPAAPGSDPGAVAKNPPITH